MRAFDVARGLKFSTLAVLAIRRDFYSNRPRALKRGSDWRQTGMDYADAATSIKECGRLAFRDDAAFLGELIDANVADRTPKEQQVIRDRFGLGGGECRTLEEIGVDLGVTKERVRQIQLKTLVKLREAGGRRYGRRDARSGRRRQGPTARQQAGTPDGRTSQARWPNTGSDGGDVRVEAQ
ncbi:MAG TPA: sigma factor-like helix-turn-helix DNA-binding protein [Tepidisphaeraceae bacterium]